MDPTVARLVALGIIAVIVIFFFRQFRGKGQLKIKNKFGELDAKGENPPPPSAIASGVKIEDAEAGRDLIAHSRGPGGVDLKKIKAQGNIDAAASLSDSPPKK